MLAMTESAAAVVRDLVAAEDAPDGGGLRITAEPTGEGEAELSMVVTEGPEEGDEVVESGGARIFLEREAATILGDKTLDAHAHDDHVHFTIEEQ